MNYAHLSSLRKANNRSFLYQRFRQSNQVENVPRMLGLYRFFGCSTRRGNNEKSYSNGASSERLAMNIRNFGRNSYITHTTGLIERVRKAEKMREIKFRAWNKIEEKMVYYDKDCSSPDMTLNGVLIAHQDQSNVSYIYELMQFTGLKDKNGLTDIYEYDIIGVDGLIKGNRYENPNLLQDETNLVIQTITSENWQEAYRQAMVRGCKHAK